jgi:hypothetical protein
VAAEIVSTNGAYDGSLTITEALACLPPLQFAPAPTPPGHRAFIHDFNTHSGPLVSTQQMAGRLYRPPYQPTAMGLGSFPVARLTK